MKNARRLVRPTSGNANFITPSERRALHFLARDRRPGGVISRTYLGQLVPGETGRHTFVGDCLWSQPQCQGRLVAVKALFLGHLQPISARKFIQANHARFLLTDCRGGPRMDKLLAPLITRVHRFGCASVYEVVSAAVAARRDA